MADPFRNELEGAMARADRAEHEAARLRQELAAAKAPPMAVPTTTPQPRSASVVFLALVLLVTVGGGVFAWTAKGTTQAYDVVDVASSRAPEWSATLPVVRVAHGLVAADDLECAPIAAANDPHAFMCRGHAGAPQRERITRELGLTPLHPFIDSPPNGCSVLRPYMAPKSIERFGHSGAAAVPKPSETVLKLLYVSPATNDVCFEIDYAGK